MSGRRRILVVDDDATIREVLTQVLLEEGYAVTAAADGPAALEALATAAPDLLVLDLSLAGPLDGSAVVTASAHLPGPTAPVLVVSARSRAELAATACAIGAAGVLSKPFDLDEFLSAVARLLPADPAPRTAAPDGGVAGAEAGGAPTVGAPGRSLHRLRQDLDALRAALGRVHEEARALAAREAAGGLSPADRHRRRVLDGEREAVRHRLQQVTDEYEARRPAD
jgi:CheY-like chemotaxis protein